MSARDHWLEFSRACVRDLDAVLLALPTRAEREPVLRAGKGGDDTTAIDAAARSWRSSGGWKRSAST